MDEAFRTWLDQLAIDRAEETIWETENSDRAPTTHEVETAYEQILDELRAEGHRIIELRDGQ